MKITVADVSLRDTGYCVININYSKDGFKTGFKTINSLRSKSDSKLTKWDKLRANSISAKAIADKLTDLQKDYETELTIIELPDFSQSNTAAVAMGLLWGCCCFLKNMIAIEPKCLKEWSGSKRGDYKDKVIELVKSRVFLPANQITNNNITDAVGIALLFSDLIYAHLQTYPQPTPTPSVDFKLQGDDRHS